MTRLVSADFLEFQQALCGVHGRYLCMTLSERDWRLRVVELGEMALMLAQEGASKLYQGASEADTYMLLVPLTGAEQTALDGTRLDRCTVVWLAPKRQFDFRAEVATRWLAVTLRGRWLRAEFGDGDRSLRRRGLHRSGCVRASLSAITQFLQLASRILRADARDPPMVRAPGVQAALRTQLLRGGVRLRGCLIRWSRHRASSMDAPRWPATTWSNGRRR
jgi:AraC family ethanolamine operon transcriptional activator